MARPAVAPNYPKPRPTDPGVRSLYREATIHPVSTATLALSQTGACHEAVGDLGRAGLHQQRFGDAGSGVKQRPCHPRHQDSPDPPNRPRPQTRQIHHVNALSPPNSERPRATAHQAAATVWVTLSYRHKEWCRESKRHLFFTHSLSLSLSHTLAVATREVFDSLYVIDRHSNIFCSGNTVGW